MDHSCNLCNKMFPTKKILVKHAKLHNRTNNVEPSSDVSCVVCNKTFVNTWNMERHTKKDHGLTEIGNVVENSVAMDIYSQQKHLSKRQ